MFLSVFIWLVFEMFFYVYCWNLNLFSICFTFDEKVSIIYEWYLSKWSFVLMLLVDMIRLCVYRREKTIVSGWMKIGGVNENCCSNTRLNYVMDLICGNVKRFSTFTDNTRKVAKTLGTFLKLTIYTAIPFINHTTS